MMEYMETSDWFVGGVRFSSNKKWVILFKTSTILEDTGVFINAKNGKTISWVRLYNNGDPFFEIDILNTPQYLLRMLENLYKA